MADKPKVARIELFHVAVPLPHTFYHREGTIEVPNKPGVLDHVLHVLARRGLNLSRIESRPTRKRLGTYQFFVDVEGHRDDAALRDAIDELSKECRVTVLGSYPRVF